MDCHAKIVEFLTYIVTHDMYYAHDENDHLTSVHDIDSFLAETGVVELVDDAGEFALLLSMLEALDEDGWTLVRKVPGGDPTSVIEDGDIESAAHDLLAQINPSYDDVEEELDEDDAGDDDVEEELDEDE